MGSWTAPTADEVQRAVAHLVRPEHRAYFFDRLENPMWVAPLDRARVFDRPPAPVPADEPGYIRFPPWPEGRYLTRVAGMTPDAVTDVLIKIDRSDNPGVTRTLLKAVSSLPPEHLRRLSGKIVEWVAAPHTDIFAEEAAGVAIALLDTGKVSAALKLIRSLLEIQPDPRGVERMGGTDSTFRPTSMPVTRVPEREYDSVLERVLDPVVDAVGLNGFRLFVALLDEALRASARDGEVDGQSDLSYIWRPAIEEHEQNSDRGIVDFLVSAVRSAALRHASKGEAETAAIVRELTTRSAIYRRIGLYVLANTNHCAGVASTMVADYETYDAPSYRHEYAALLRARFLDVDEATRHRVLEWIRRGPDLDAYRRRRTEIGEPEPQDEELNRYTGRWRRDRYSFVSSQLQGTDAEEYNRLIESLGEPEHPDFASWSSTHSGAESPVAQDDLVKRKPSEAIGFLRQWRLEDEEGESTWRPGPSMEGLGRVFAEVVAARPQEYALVSGDMRDMAPTYVRAFFSGLQSALKKGASISWREPLRLAIWVVEQPADHVDEPRDLDRDPAWRWTRREIASVVRAGLSKTVNRIPFELRGEVWSVLEQLTHDPHPSAEYETRYGGDNMDPFMLSLNTNRGDAMHAVVEYALWCRRELEQRGEDVTRGFELIPEAKDVLERHLDREQEPSLAVRSVYGRWLPWLLLLDQNWTEEWLSLIFPPEPDAALLRDTAWTTYVQWCPPYDSVLSLLRHQYEWAVREVPSGRNITWAGSDGPDVKLGEHLVTFHWRGLLEQNLLNQYFSRAGDELVAQVIEFVGHALRNTKQEVAASVRERIQALGDWRLSVIETNPQNHVSEARALGGWFASDKLDEAWALATLARTVRLAGAPSLSRPVVERLVGSTRQDPVSVTRILLEMLERPERRLEHVIWRDEAKLIVHHALASGDSQAVEHAKDVVDFYVRHGEPSFRELLRSSGPG